MIEPSLGEELFAEVKRVARIIANDDPYPETLTGIIWICRDIVSACKAAINNDISAMQRALKCLKEYRDD